MKCHWKRGLFKIVHFLAKILENLERESLEILESSQGVENKGESDHLLESLENFQRSSSEKTPTVMTPLFVTESGWCGEPRFMPDLFESTSNEICSDTCNGP